MMKSWGLRRWVGAGVMIYGGVIHNQCHCLCVFFCQATDGQAEKEERGGAHGGGVVN